MKAKLEAILVPQDTSSFNFFKLEVPAFPSYWHYHPELELTYIKKGQGLRFVGDNISSFEAGDLVLLGENLPHNWASDQPTPEEPQLAFVMQFSKQLFLPFPECKAVLQLFKAAQHGLLFTDPSEQFLEQLEKLESLSAMERLIALFELLNQLSQDKSCHALSSIAYAKNTLFEKHQSRVSEVTAYILAHCDQAMPLEQVANFSNMTPPSFCRWFKQSVGHSFVTYLNIVRIEKACQYLLNSDWPIAQIAFQSGFESISHFNRTFKQVKQESPGAYRKARKLH